MKKFFGSDSGSGKLKYFGSGSVLGSKKCGTVGLYRAVTLYERILVKINTATIRNKLQLILFDF